MLYSLVFITGVMLGTLVSFVVLISNARYLLNKFLAKDKSTAPTQDDGDVSSVKKRMKKIREMVELQAKLQSESEGPSRASIEAKYKGGIAGEIRRLEEDKTEILKSILDDGYNPSVTVLTETGTETLSLKEYLEEQGYTQDSKEEKKEEAKIKPDDAPRKIGKFFVYKGGKSDGNNGGNTTH